MSNFQENNSMNIDAADIQEAETILSRVRRDLAELTAIKKTASSTANRAIQGRIASVVDHAVSQRSSIQDAYLMDMARRQAPAGSLAEMARAQAKNPVGASGLVSRPLSFLGL